MDENPYKAPAEGQVSHLTARKPPIIMRVLVLGAILAFAGLVGVFAVKVGLEFFGFPPR